MSTGLSINNNRFKDVRSQTGALANDGTPNPATWSEAQKFDAQGCKKVVFYWDATTATGTVAVTVWLRDKSSSADIYVAGAQVTGLAPKTLAALDCYGASDAVLIFSAISGGGGSAAFIRAIGSSE